jgi:dTDP-4-amino-4,6-dideoxygalactose transaminase/predicted dehydrogenase
MASLLERGVRKLRRIALRKTASFRSPVDVAVIGFGGIAPDHVESYEETGIARVVAVSDLLPSNLARALDRWPSLRAYRAYRQLLEEVRPDVVSVCTWPQSHVEVVEAAVAAGVKGILCEKPLALQMSEVERMGNLCAARGVKLAGGHQYRFHPHFVKAAEVVRSGGLGTVSRVRGNIKSTLANNGPHLIDTVRFVLGDPPAERVSGHCRRDRNEFSRGLPAEDASSGQVDFGGGVCFEFVTGDLSPDFFSITVEGDQGALEVSPQRLTVNGADLTDRSRATSQFRQRQFSDFLRWVKGQATGYAADFREGARTTELVLALYESARLGQPVELPLQNKGDVITQLYPESRAEPPEAASETALPSVKGTGERLAMDGGRRVVASWFTLDPSLGAPELVNLTRVILSKNLCCTGGQMVPDLERAFASHYGSPRAVASTSGTAAIHVALGALGLNPGDEVITTPMTDMGTVIPILACNCLPVFADVDPITGNLTAESIARRITPKTRAVILVHLFGFPADLSGVVDLLRGKGIALVEDCAQAHDAAYHGKKVGTFGDFGCFSLQQSKQITCGDGGVTLVNREDLAERAALFVDKGWDRKQGVRAHLFLGMNYRMTELQAAVALAQLRRLPGLVRARRAAAERLTRLLLEIPGIVPPAVPEGTNPSWWMYPFGIQEDRVGVDADRFAEALTVEGVKVRRRYLPEPIFEYEMLKHQRTYGDSRYPFSAFPYEPPDLSDFPGLQEFGRRLLFMAWSHNVRPSQVDGIASAVRKVAILVPLAWDKSRGLAASCA